MSKKTSKPEGHRNKLESLSTRLGPPDSDFTRSFDKDVEISIRHRPSKEDSALILKTFGIKNAR
jgi:hypothetical protein